MLIYIIYIIIPKIGTKNDDSYIIIKINQKGYHRIFFTGNSQEQFCKGITNIPTSVFINNVEINNCPNEYNFTLDENTIKLYFSNDKINYNCLFYQCTAISEIDLTFFNASNILAMSGMFKDCSSLTSINFGNIDVSKVQQTNHMFCGCSALKSLDISNFNNYNNHYKYS